MRVYIEGIGLCGPGFDGWPASQPMLNGMKTYVKALTRIPSGSPLPSNERRRAVQTVRLALAVGTEAISAASRDPAEVATVFASSGGDGETIHQILTILASPDPELSPTRFHNSVHNAPAGYWGIATGSKAPSSGLCCHDDSFAAGLLEAAVQVTVDNHVVTLIAYDMPYPAPLGLVRPIAAPFAAALVLAPTATENALACVDVVLRPKTRAASVMTAPTLEGLRRGTPAAHGLPLLEALAQDYESEVALGYLSEMELDLKVRPLTGATTGRSTSLENAG